MKLHFRCVLAGVLLAAASTMTASLVNGLTLFSGSSTRGYSGYRQIRPVGDVSSMHRWRCDATVGRTRLYATGFNETSARQKLLAYTSSRFHCRRNDSVSNR